MPFKAVQSSVKKAAFIPAIEIFASSGESKMFSVDYRKIIK
jgi:hypothetical protein